MEPQVKHLEPAQGLEKAVSKEAPSASRAACRLGFFCSSWNWGASLEVDARMTSGAVWRQELAWEALMETA